eukprot:CAMPEP_0174714196 /NCGR_PEP_ID=MMETSP1094-20130205/17102_1 /TAXON_ID=156173 /ORGANISM="Chrysochromulina brevifilum, Strain UTEX LB 985" /LENGTH=69 /DNA_ID=CAMNT_0015913501 /DNA_START=26 /DNA_END=235 /DNA_ORIENTATION=+
MDEEETVDPKTQLDANCSAKLDCAKALVAYERCAERIEAKGSGQCAGQYMDYVRCVDICASAKLFSALK